MDSQPNDVLAQLLALASRYAGRKAQSDSLIYGDLDINGSDFVEFVQEVERQFNVDLDWVSPRQSGVAAQDTTIGALANDVLRQRH
jgi:hypothetical protein